MRLTRLSGDEIFCLTQKHYQAKNFIFANSVYSSRLIGNIASSTRATVGEELKEPTQLLSEARTLAYQRMLQQVVDKKSHGIIKINQELIQYPGYIEFLSSGSIVQNEHFQDFFTASCDGQAFYALLDLGYHPCAMVCANSVYATGWSLGILSSLKPLIRGEMHEYSQAITHTRERVLQRLIENAKTHNTTAVLTINTIFTSLGKGTEMLLVGSACKQSQPLENKTIITSNLSSIEMWNLAKLGYAPMQLLISSKVFSLGMSTNIRAALKALVGTENTEVKQILSQCREAVLQSLQEKANAIGAEMVIASKVYINPLGNGLTEFLSIGTAVQKSTQISPQSEQLPIQCLITEKYKISDSLSLRDLKENTSATAFMRFTLLLIIVLFLVLLAAKNRMY